MMKVNNIPNIAQLVERPTVEDVEIGRSLVRIRVFGIIFAQLQMTNFTSFQFMRVFLMMLYFKLTGFWGFGVTALSAPARARAPP